MNRVQKATLETCFQATRTHRMAIVDVLKRVRYIPHSNQEQELLIDVIQGMAITEDKLERLLKELT